MFATLVLLLYVRVKSFSHRLDKSQICPCYGALVLQISGLEQSGSLATHVLISESHYKMKAVCASLGVILKCPCTKTIKYIKNTFTGSDTCAKFHEFLKMLKPSKTKLLHLFHQKKWNRYNRAFALSVLGP